MNFKWGNMGQQQRQVQSFSPCFPRFRHTSSPTPGCPMPRHVIMGTERSIPVGPHRKPKKVTASDSHPRVFGCSETETYHGSGAIRTRTERFGARSPWALLGAIRTLKPWARTVEFGSNSNSNSCSRKKNHTSSPPISGGFNHV